MDFLNDVLSVLGGATLVFFFLLALGFVGILLMTIVGVFVVSIADIINRDDLAIGKVIWIAAVLLVPAMGLIAYWLSRPKAYDPAVATMHRSGVGPSIEAPASTTSTQQAA